MRIIIKYVILIIITLQYFVGSVGFTIHHCCCKKVYHTSSILADVFAPYHVHECLKVKEMKEAGGKLMFRQWRHCGSYVYSMEQMKYNCQEKMTAPPLYLMLTQDLSLVVKDITLLVSTLDVSSNNPIVYNHVLKRRWQEPDSLCTFII